MNGLEIMQKRFLDAIHNPSPDVVSLRQRLIARAEEKVASIQTEQTLSKGGVDVIVAGSGFLSTYFLGVYTVLSRVTELKRFAGASSGAQAPFQLLLTGEAETLTSYLTHGQLCGKEWLGPAMLSADRNWKALAKDLITRHGESLSKLDGTCSVSVTQLTWRGPRNKLYSHWSHDPRLCEEAFYATGTALAKCDGFWCTDGGLTNNEPEFADRPEGRATLLVRPSRSGLPMRMAVGYDLKQCQAAIERGQDDALRLLQKRSDVSSALEWIAAE